MRPPPRATLCPYTTLFRSPRGPPAPRGERRGRGGRRGAGTSGSPSCRPRTPRARRPDAPPRTSPRSEEHTSELQSLRQLVCSLLLEKKNTVRLLPAVVTEG